MPGTLRAVSDNLKLYYVLHWGRTIRMLNFLNRIGRIIVYAPSLVVTDLPHESKNWRVNKDPGPRLGGRYSFLVDVLHRWPGYH